MSLLDDCAAAILLHAGPFSEISDDGLEGLELWLQGTPSGRSSTRAQLCERMPAVHASLMDVLGFVGAIACDFQLSRMRSFAIAGRPVDLELSRDALERGRSVVATAGTILCPDEDDP